MAALTSAYGKRAQQRYGYIGKRTWSFSFLLPLVSCNRNNFDTTSRLYLLPTHISPLSSTDSPLAYASQFQLVSVKYSQVTLSNHQSMFVHRNIDIRFVCMIHTNIYEYAQSFHIHMYICTPVDRGIYHTYGYGKRKNKQRQKTHF